MLYFNPIIVIFHLLSGRLPKNQAVNVRAIICGEADRSHLSLLCAECLLPLLYLITHLWWPGSPCPSSLGCAGHNYQSLLSADVSEHVVLEVRCVFLTLCITTPPSSHVAPLECLAEVLLS